MCPSGFIGGNTAAKTVGLVSVFLREATTKECEFIKIVYNEDG